MLQKPLSTDELLSWLHTANCQGLAGLLRRLEQTTGRRVFLTDPTFEILAADELETTTVLDQELTSAIRQAYFSAAGVADESMKILRLDSGSRLLNIYVYNLVVGKKLHGRLLVEAEGEEQRSTGEMLIEQILPVILSEVIKLNEIRETEKKFQDNFIYDLLHNNISSLKTIVKQGQLWGWDFARPHQLLIADLTPKNKNIPFSILKGLVSQVTTSQFKNPVVVEYDQQCLILVPETAQKTRQELRTDIKKLGQAILNRIAVELPDFRASIGIGRFYPTATDLCRSYQEAKTALELGRLLGTDLGVYHFDDLGLIRLLADINYDQLGDYCLEYLQDLIRYDDHNGTKLLETLEQYLKNSGDYNLTSQSLFIHPNTLRNRIKKIEEIFHTDLEHYENIVNLWTAVKIYNLLEDMIH